jgi:hypothetical protein
MENQSIQQEYHFDVIVAGLNLEKLEAKLSTVIASSFTLMVSVCQLISYITEKRD